MNKNWMLETGGELAALVIRQQCARAIPARLWPLVAGDPRIVELLDEEAEAQGPAVRDWNPLDGV